MRALEFTTSLVVYNPAYNQISDKRDISLLRRAVRKRSPSRDYFCLAFVAALAYFESFAHISLFHACQVVTFTKRIKIYV